MSRNGQLQCGCCRVPVCLGSVSPSPYKVALRKPGRDSTRIKSPVPPSYEGEA